MRAGPRHDFFPDRGTSEYSGAGDGNRSRMTPRQGRFNDYRGGWCPYCAVRLVTRCFIRTKRGSRRWAGACSEWNATARDGTPLDVANAGVGVGGGFIRIDKLASMLHGGPGLYLDRLNIHMERPASPRHTGSSSR